MPFSEIILNWYHKNNKLLYPIVDANTIGDELEDNIFENDRQDFSMNELLKMIDELQPNYKMVFNLYAIENYTHKETATMLNIPEGTSKSHYSKAREVLKEMIIEKQHQGNIRYGTK